MNYLCKLYLTEAGRVKNEYKAIAANLKHVLAIAFLVALCSCGKPKPAENLAEAAFTVCSERALEAGSSDAICHCIRQEAVLTAREVLKDMPSSVSQEALRIAEETMVQMTFLRNGGREAFEQHFAGYDAVAASLAGKILKGMASACR